MHHAIMRVVQAARGSVAKTINPAAGRRGEWGAGARQHTHANGMMRVVEWWQFEWSQTVHGRLFNKVGGSADIIQTDCENHSSCFELEGSGHTVQECVHRF
jgi:hypothetical protein